MARKRKGRKALGWIRSEEGKEKNMKLVEGRKENVSGWKEKREKG